MEKTGIKASDLRIGNYVEVNSEYLKIDGITEDGINPYFFEGGYGDSGMLTYDAEFDKNEIKPIPLTEEWLLRIEKNSIFNNGFAYWERKKGRFEIHLGAELVTTIEFLHELQNLNFALTGEELQFANQ